MLRVQQFRGLVVFFTLAATFTLSNASAQNTDLRYQPPAGLQFAYEIEITADTPSKVTTLKGVTRYTVNSVNGDQLNLTYRGGLSESSKAKNMSGGGRPGFGPFGPG